MPAIPDNVEPRWYCVRTRHGAELTADINIRLAGFTVFAPSLFKPATPARRSANGALRAAQPDRIVPLFRRYLFVQFRCGVDPWQQIRKLPGDAVEQILGATPELPTAVPDTAIALIRGMCAPNGCLYPASHHDRPLAVGANARFLTGPMADLTGICAWSDGRRVKLLLEMMGCLVPVKALQAEVEVVT
jgi:transcription antitermination factor NusG